MIGDLASARVDYDQAYALGWDAEPGNALLLFETGDLEGALAAIDRVWDRSAWTKKPHCFATAFCPIANRSSMAPGKSSSPERGWLACRDELRIISCRLSRAKISQR
jgi:hypothetical protein